MARAKAHLPMRIGDSSPLDQFLTARPRWTSAVALDLHLRLACVGRDLSSAKPYSRTEISYDAFAEQ